MKESFYTIHKAAVVEVDIKRSKFIAAASPVDDEDAANSFIERMKEEHKRATHNVFAYLINEQVMRCSDDGESGLLLWLHAISVGLSWVLEGWCGPIVMQLKKLLTVQGL